MATRNGEGMVKEVNIGQSATKHFKKKGEGSTISKSYFIGIAHKCE